MEPTTASRLKRREIRRILRSRRGEMAQLAKAMKIDASLVTLAIKGNHGGRVGKEREAIILAAAERRAKEILAENTNGEG